MPLVGICQMLRVTIITTITSFLVFVSRAVARPRKPFLRPISCRASAESFRLSSGGSGKTVLMVVVLLLLISGVVGIYLMTSSPSTNNSGDSDDSGGGSGTSGGGVSYGGGTSGGKPPSPPSYVKGVPARAVICTVNGQAVYPSMLPFDPLCDMLIFCHVTLRNADIVGTDNKVSFDTFKKVMAKYETQAGISFDIRYVTAKDLNSTYEPAFDKLVNNSRIVHYGVLDVWASSSDFKNVYEKAKDVLKTCEAGYIKKGVFPGVNVAFAKSDPSYVFLFEDDESLKYKGFCAAPHSNVRISNSQPAADTVIVYTAVGWIEKRSIGYSHPPSIFKRRLYNGTAAAQANRAPDILSEEDRI
ncbi:hypothetical protein HPB50_000077 [Hyalomma asiaticum]|uniref:Uncharacterized protein n=1 Tax=Hyalomma asiaticum TaxID=266040 RepID=A0ACB7T0T0_HYAAI|nr:hypothetical protein HPB50_000077 [Hyalomma asiaticum]